MFYNQAVNVTKPLKFNDVYGKWKFLEIWKNPLKEL